MHQYWCSVGVLRCGESRARRLGQANQIPPDLGASCQPSPPKVPETKRPHHAAAASGLQIARSPVVVGHDFCCVLRAAARPPIHAP